ncbi:MAG: orotidine-5'-phosphate decarboxylase [Pseudobdellovibrionaceae bacterium]
MGKIIVALDVPSEAEAQHIVDELADEINFYKIGLQLLTAAGPNFIKKLITAQKKIFLDLKLFEIPNSVKSAVLAAGDLGVSMITVHASSGTKIMESAVKAASSFPDLKILALTVVTSMNDQDLREIGIQGGCEDQVLRLAKLAKKVGCHGLIASPAELIPLRRFTKDMTIVTPGIRLNGEKSTEQRSDTPESALRNGASFIIMGRSILDSPNPKLIVRKIFESV